MSAMRYCWSEIFSVCKSELPWSALSSLAFPWGKCEESHARMSRVYLRRCPGLMSKADR